MVHVMDTPHSQFGYRAIHAQPVRGGMRYRARSLPDGGPGRATSAQNARDDTPIMIKNRDIVVLRDNYRLVRECVAKYITDHCPEIFVQGLGRQLVADADADQLPQLVIVNVQAGSLDDAALRAELNMLSASSRGAPLLIISDRDEAQECLRAFEAGCAGFFPMSCGAPQLIAAIRLIMAGGQFIPPSILAMADRTTHGNSGPGPRKNGKCDA